MSQKEREKHVLLSQEGMSKDEWDAFQEFRKSGNKYLEKNNGIDSTPWTTCFVTFMNMIRAFGDNISRMNFSEPFRIVIDYDPEHPRVLIRRYSNNKCASESCPAERE